MSLLDAFPDGEDETDDEWRCPAAGCTAPLDRHPVERAARELRRAEREGRA